MYHTESLNFIGEWVSLDHQAPVDGFSHATIEGSRCAYLIYVMRNRHLYSEDFLEIVDEEYAKYLSYFPEYFV